jgi:tRNA/tmRNA/rRNA uracil-C5-methylase (TrmA/RlmC/RlmD family)
VSCNPSTLAKDSATLLGAGYALKWVQPVDMFPQTAQVEAVALFEQTL